MKGGGCVLVQIRQCPHHPPWHVVMPCDAYSVRVWTSIEYASVVPLPSTILLLQSFFLHTLFASRHNGGCENYLDLDRTEFPSQSLRFRREGGARFSSSHYTIGREDALRTARSSLSTSAGGRSPAR